MGVRGKVSEPPPETPFYADSNELLFIYIDSVKTHGDVWIVIVPDHTGGSSCRTSHTMGKRGRVEVNA